jgi:ankyrin repeat protein
MKRIVLIALTVLPLVLCVAVVSTKGQQGPISGAAADGDLGRLQTYLGSGGDPNVADGIRGSRPLAAAARYGNLPAMNALLAAGADPNSRDASGNRWVPLMHAIHKHRLEPVRLLLERGARADGPPELSVTPLMMAVGSGQTDVARLLLDRGADPGRRLPDGASLLTLALSGGALTDIDEPLLGQCHLETVKLLRDRAPDLKVEGETWRGRWARFFAHRNGCDAAIALVDRNP